MSDPSLFSSISARRFIRPKSYKDVNGPRVEVVADEVPEVTSPRNGRLPMSGVGSAALAREPYFFDALRGSGNG